ncbi:elongation factor Ts [Candidatus Uhrbacteria bacterium]|nr:elongation factor Ts [Candidatus Uhrbacteria bacterium]
MIDQQTLTKLREFTGAGIVDCKKALDEAGGDFNGAVELLRKKGQKVAANKQERETKEGRVHAYIHGNGKAGALVEVLCETDFVARNEQFIQFCHGVAMHVVASNPLYIKPEDISDEIIAKEREIYEEQMAGENKPAEIKEKILQGKLAKYYAETCLLKQQFIIDDSQTVEQYLTGMIAKIGEKIEIRRFSRFALS